MSHSESLLIRIAMLQAGIQTNAELAALCFMAPQTMNRVVCGANTSPIARRRVQNVLGQQIWEGVPLDVNPEEHNKAMRTKIDWKAPAYPPPEWVFRALRLPVDAPADVYYETFDRLIVEPLRFTSDAELFSLIVTENTQMRGMRYCVAVEAAASEHPGLAAAPEAQEQIKHAREVEAHVLNMRKESESKPNTVNG